MCILLVEAQRSFGRTLVLGCGDGDIVVGEDIAVAGPVSGRRTIDESPRPFTDLASNESEAHNGDPCTQD